MDYLSAKKIMATVLSTPRVADRLGPLLEERRRMAALGMIVQVGEIDRTIDDLAGYYDDGRLVGARQIGEASRLLANR